LPDELETRRQRGTDTRLFVPGEALGVEPSQQLGPNQDWNENFVPWRLWSITVVSRIKIEAQTNASR
jgi:hypothetical protein